MTSLYAPKNMKRNKQVKMDNKQNKMFIYSQYNFYYNNDFRQLVQISVYILYNQFLFTSNWMIALFGYVILIQ